MKEPALVIICGPPCSGKSTLARELAALTGWPRLEMDAVRARILPGAAHTRADRQAAYRAMALAAEQLLRAGVSVILDAPYGHREDREEIAALLASVGARLRLLQCKVSPEVALEWFTQREPGPRLDLTAARVAEMNAAYRFAPNSLIVDTGEGKTFPELARALLSRLTEGPPDDPHAWAAATPK